MPDKEEMEEALRKLDEALDKYEKEVKELSQNLKDFETRVLTKLRVIDNLLGGEV